MRQALGMVARTPVTLAALALFAALQIVALVVRLTGHDHLRDFVGTGIGPLAEHGNGWSPLTYGLFADHALEFVGAALALLVAGTVAERLIGRLRMVVALIVPSAVGAAIGMTVEAADVFGLHAWDDRAPVVDPFAPILGALFTASAFANQLWRRRIRLLGIGALLAMTLYSGTSVDVFRLVTAGAGTALGMALAPPARRAFRWIRSSEHEERSLLAGLTLLGAIGPFAAIVSGSPWGPLHPIGLLLRVDEGTAVLPCEGVATTGCVADVALTRVDEPGAVLLSVLPLAVLALAAYGLWRGRRVAAWLAIAVNGMFAVLAAVYFAVLPLLPDEGQLRLESDAGTFLPRLLAIALPLAMVVLLATAIRHFPVRPSARSVRRFWLSVGGAGLGAGLVYVLLGSLVRDQFRPPVTALGLIVDFSERLIPPGFLSLRDLAFRPEGPIADLLYTGIGSAFWLVLLGASGLVVYGAAGRVRASRLGRVRALLRRGGDGSLSHMATWQGNEYWVADDESTAVAYRVVADVAITTGGPIGPAECRADAIAGFTAFCDAHGWVPVFYGVGDDLRELLESRGWATASVGADAVLSPATFSMRGKRWQDVRTSINRAGKLGVEAQWTTWDDLGLPARSQIQVISEEWVAARNLPEMRFTLGGVDELQDAEVRLLLAVAPSGRVEAVTSWLPTYRDGVVVGWTLDVMRRRPDSMNGVVEFLIARMMQRAAVDGIEFVSLSAAPLAGLAAESAESDLTSRVLGFLGRRLESLYGFRSLLAFKEKFQPELRSLHLAYPDPVLLPAVGIAIARAYLPSMTMPQAVALMRFLVFPEQQPGAVSTPPVPAS